MYKLSSTLQDPNTKMMKRKVAVSVSPPSSAKGCG
jgi:hypothetical protein